MERSMLGMYGLPLKANLRTKTSDITKKPERDFLIDNFCNNEFALIWNHPDPLLSLHRVVTMADGVAAFPIDIFVVGDICLND